MKLQNALLASALAITLATTPSSLHVPYVWRDAPVKAISKQTKVVKPSPEQCLASALYHEARGEGELGMKAVASVIFNRARKLQKPLCAIILSPSQFSYQNGFKSLRKAPNGFVKDSKRMLSLYKAKKWQDVTGGATHYAHYSVDNKWTRVYIVTSVIGNHVFYREGDS